MGKKIMAFVLAMLLALSAGVPAVGAQTLADMVGLEDNTSVTETEVDTYEDVLDAYAHTGATAAQGDAISVDISAAVSEEKVVPEFGPGFDGDDQNALQWNHEEPFFEWVVTLEQEGLYFLEITYSPMGEKVANIQRTLLIDGEVPFDEANGIIFRARYIETGEVTTNNVGDQVRPQMVRQGAWISYKLECPDALYTEPFKFFLEKGEHQIRFNYLEGGLAIRSLRLIPATDPVPYEELAKSYEQNALPIYTGEQIVMQAEEALYRNDEVLRREYNTDPGCEPYSFGYRVLNVIGDERFKEGGQSITWELDVPQTGLYKLGMRVLQSWNDGLPSSRRIEIDDAVPFQELQAYRFPFDENWKQHTLSDENGDPYLFYLTEGKHTLTMTVVMDFRGSIVLDLEEAITKLLEFYREIKSITGPNPDVNYDYQFERVIPNLTGKIQTIKTLLDDCILSLEKAAQKQSSMVSNFRRVSELLDGLEKDPYSIARKLSTLYDSSTELSTWLNEFDSQPLAIDTFTLAAPDKEITGKQVGIWDYVKSFCMSFFLSFVKDYDSVGTTAGENITETIDVWVSRNSEWAEIMKDQADEQFTQTSGVALRINVVPSGQLNSGVNVLLLSVVSGNAPDVVVGVDQNMPVEFAIRDAVCPLNTFDGFEEIKARFYDESFTPVTYEGNIYALPETMDFMVMFYRKDIFEQLNLQVPKTWDDMYNKVLPVLSQNNMEFYYNSGINLFMFQHDAPFYSDDGKYTRMGEESAYQAFKQWVSLYTDYNVPVTTNFFNRFRSGEVPLGVAGFNDYILLRAAAPELFSKWGIAEVPALTGADGYYNQSSGKIAGTYVSVLQGSTKKDASFAFIDWWTDAQTQGDYATSVESIIGIEGRYCSANKEAFDMLPWGKEEASVIKNSLQNAKERPVVLGGYYSDRHITNAQNRVLMDGAKPRDSLSVMVKDINRELLTKRKEFGKE